MKRTFNSKLLTIPLLLTTLCFVSTGESVAQENSVAKQVSAALLAGRDKDGDGKLSVGEFGSFQLEVFQKYDSDNDGFVTLEEMNRDIAASALKLNNSLARKLDSDSDGKLSSEEIENAAQVLRSLDSNRDNDVTREELLQLQPSEPAQGRTTWKPGEHKTEFYIQTLCYGCNAYKSVHGKYPDSLNELYKLPAGKTMAEWRGPYVQEPYQNDAWGNPIQYAQECVVSSAGLDGEMGTDDDIRMTVSQLIRQKRLKDERSKMYGRMQGLRLGCIAYKREHDTFPKSLLNLFEPPENMLDREWKGPYVRWPKEELKDLWDNPYIHEIDKTNDKVVIRSCGPDEVANTTDDILHGR